MGTTAQTFYLEPDDQDDTWGTTVKQLDPVQTTTNTTTMTMTFGTSTSSQTRTVIPYAAAGAAGNDAINRQWAVNQAGADGTESVTGARRIFPAGVWTASCIINVPQGAAVTGAISCDPTALVYRVAAGPSYARTLLFSCDAPAQSTTAISGAQDFTFALSSPSQPTIILEPGETLSVGWIIVSTQTAGLVGATVTNTQTFKTGATTWLQCPAPGMRTQYSSSLPATSSAIAARSLKVGKTLASTGSSAASLLRLIGIRFSASSTAVAALSRLIQPGRYLVTGAAVAAVSKKVGLTKSVTGSAAAATVKKAFKSFSVAGAPTPAFNRTLTGSRSFSVTGSAVAVFTRAIIAVRAFSAASSGVASLVLKFGQDALNRIVGGATITKGPSIVFVKGRPHIKLSDPDQYG